MATQGDRRRPRGWAGTIPGWALLQVWALARLVVSLTVGGVVAALWRRQFAGRAFVLGLATAGAASWLALEAAMGVASHGGAAATPLLAGVVLAMALMGLAVGWAAGRMGYHEVTLASWLVAASMVASCLRPYPGERAVGFGSRLAWAWRSSRQPLSVPMGESLLGSLWLEKLGLALAAGFLLALVAASLALMARRPRLAVEWYVARRHLGGRRRGVSAVTQVAVMGIALGVASLVAVTAVMSGYQEDIEEKILGVNAHLVVQKYGLDFDEWPEVVLRARATHGVQAAAPFVFGEVMVAGGGGEAAILLKGVERLPAGPRVVALDHSLVAGPDGEPASLAAALAADGEVPRLVLGTTLLQRLGLAVGDPVVITTPVTLAELRGQAPARQLFRVGGAFSSGMHEFDSGLAFVELGAGQRLFGMGERVSGVELRLARPREAEAVGARLLASLGRYPYHVQTWHQLNTKIFTALSLQKVVMYLVLTFIVVVASFNIASTLFIAVIERAGDIAVLKTMGADDLSVLRIFVLQGWTVGLVGTALGVGLGLAVAWTLGQLNLGIAADVYMVERLRVRVDAGEVALTAAASLAISHLATLYPSLRGALVPPVEALRLD